MRRLLAVLALGALVVGCSEKATAPDPDGTPGISASVTNAAYLARPGRITWLDSQGDWDVFLAGFDPADMAVCHVGDPTPRGIPVREHYGVTHETTDYPAEHDVVVTIGRPPLFMYTRATVDNINSHPDPAERCALWQSEWIASGSWSALMYEDNDLSGFDGSPGINSFGVNETGVLLGKDGTRYRYEWKYRAYCDPALGCDVRGRSEDHVVRVGN